MGHPVIWDHFYKVVCKLDAKLQPIKQREEEYTKEIVRFSWVSVANWLPNRPNLATDKIVWQLTNFF